MVGFLVWLAGAVRFAAAAAAPPFLPAPFDVTTSGQGCQKCGRENCTQTCQGKQCFNLGKSGGCCAEPPAPHLKCVVAAAGPWGQGCKLGCCHAVYVETTLVMPVVCGKGCCKPGSHGSPHKCGRTAPSKHGEKVMPCCVPDEKSEEDQWKFGCCRVGPGHRCDTEDQGYQGCCLSQAAAAGFSPSPFEVCQRNCSGYRRCGQPLGYDCRGRAGHPQSRGKQRCCPRHGAEPSVHDPCQMRREECEDGGRFRECPEQKTGVDCRGKVEQVCCLQDADCYGSCEEYYAHLKTTWAIGIAVSVGVLACLASICYRLRGFLRRKWRALPCFRGPEQQFFLPGGQVMPAFELRRRSRYVALVIGCSKYAPASNYRCLPNANQDAEAMAKLLSRLGYEVLQPKLDATHADMEAGFKELAWLLQGSEALGVVFYAGHAEESGGKMVWVTTDALRFPVTEFCARLQAVHTEDGMQFFGLEQPAKETVLAVFGDCCRVPPKPEDVEHVHMDFAAVARNRRQKMEIYFVYASDPGREAFETGHSLFLAALLQHLPQTVSLDNLYTRVADYVQKEGKAWQRCWKKSSGSSGGHVCLAGPNIINALVGADPQTSSSRRVSTASTWSGESYISTIS